MRAMIGLLMMLMLLHEPAAAENAEPAFAAKRGIGGIRTFGFPIARDAKAGTFAVDPYRPPWSEEMQRGRLDELGRAGFDFIRLNIDPGPLLALPEAEREPLFGLIEAAVTSSQAAGLAVLVDLHPTEGHPVWGAAKLTTSQDAAAFRRYREIVGRMARLVDRHDPRRVALEIFNEPPPPCRWTGRTGWPDLLALLHAEARRQAPRHTLVVGGACYAGIDGLLQLDGRRFDANTTFTFHYYGPHVFTHQGYWGASDKFIKHVAPLPYPPDPAVQAATLAEIQARIMRAADLSPAERTAESAKARRRIEAYFGETKGAATIREHFREVADWAAKQGVAPGRILLGEFGTMKDVYGYTGARPADRARWLSDVRTEAERLQFAWSAWALTNTMGIVTRDLDGPLDATVLTALGLGGAPRN
jgi:hypothetical protein